jgi:hypothetical protein
MQLRETFFDLLSLFEQKIGGLACRSCIRQHIASLPLGSVEPKHLAAGVQETAWAFTYRPCNIPIDGQLYDHICDELATPAKDTCTEDSPLVITAGHIFMVYLKVVKASWTARTKGTLAAVALIGMPKAFGIKSDDSCSHQSLRDRLSKIDPTDFGSYSLRR